MRKIYTKPEIAVTSFEAGTKIMIVSGGTQDVTSSDMKKIEYSTLP